MFTQRIKEILDFYPHESPALKMKLARLLLHGNLSGTGRLLIYPVDQGFEHGPVSFLNNTAAFDPLFHMKLAIEAKVSAFAAPLGVLQAGICDETYLSQIPLILKLNSNNALMDQELSPDSALTASVDDAIALGCIGVGFTIYPGSDAALTLLETAKEIIKEARLKGLLTIIWAYPRGSISQEGETAVDVISYAAHMSCLLGAHIVKVKLPTQFCEDKKMMALYKESSFFIETLSERVRLIVKSCFNGKRIVLFSGGDKKEEKGVLNDAKAIFDGGGFGSIIGRNCFKRPFNEGLDLLNKLSDVYKNINQS
jgi:class I fructose-bisphosphate aldolase